jgi:hypothetical protein
MSLFAEIEKTIERGFRHWTDKVFGPAESDQLLVLHHAILQAIDSRIQTLKRGGRIFPYAGIVATFHAADPQRRQLLQAAFGQRLEADVREALASAGCMIPRGFKVEVRTAESGIGPFQLEFQTEPPASTAAAGDRHASLVIVQGKIAHDCYTLEKANTNIGRMAELTDPEGRVVRRNDVVFEEGADPINATVSRRHAHIRRESGEYRLFDDESEYGTSVFRDGRILEVPPGNDRGEKLRPGDEIYLGQACLRFEM